MQENLSSNSMQVNAKLPQPVWAWIEVTAIPHHSSDNTAVVPAMHPLFMLLFVCLISCLAFMVNSLDHVEMVSYPKHSFPTAG